MSLSIRQRIAIAMTAVVLMNTLAATVSWLLSAEAERQAARAARATARAEWVSAFTIKVTEFLSDVADTGLASHGPQVESTGRYGSLQGRDNSIRLALVAADRHLSGSDLSSVRTEWDELRRAEFAWINVEAQASGRNLRLAIGSDGKMHAAGGMVSAVETPPSLAGMSPSLMRIEVRRQAERFKDLLQRRIARAARAEAAEARAAEAGSRLRAGQITIGMLVASLLVAFLAAGWLYRRVAAPLAAARTVAEAVTAGHMEARFPAHGDDEVGMLIDAVEEMRAAVVGKVATLREMAGAVLVTSDAVSESVDAVRAAAPAGVVALDSALADASQRTGTLTTLAEEMLSA